MVLTPRTKMAQSTTFRRFKLLCVDIIETQFSIIRDHFWCLGPS